MRATLSRWPRARAGRRRATWGGSRRSPRSRSSTASAILRAPPADRPPALGHEGRRPRTPTVAPWPAPPGDVRRARADLRQVRPAALDAARRRAAGHRPRAPEAAGRRDAVPVRAGRAGRRERARAVDREAVRRVLGAARRRGVDRPGARGRAPERPPRRRQGAASECAAARSRPTCRSSTRRPRSRRNASARSTSSTLAESWTSSPARSARSSTTATRRETRRPSTATSPGTPTSVSPR